MLCSPYECKFSAFHRHHYQWSDRQHQQWSWKRSGMEHWDDHKRVLEMFRYTEQSDQLDTQAFVNAKWILGCEDACTTEVQGWSWKSGHLEMNSAKKKKEAQAQSSCISGLSGTKILNLQMRHIPLSKPSMVMRPSNAKESIFFCQWLCPTKSMITSAPFPWVILFTSSEKSWVL